jgi:hypothetical protein
MIKPYLANLARAKPAKAKQTRTSLGTALVRIAFLCFFAALARLPTAEQLIDPATAWPQARQTALEQTDWQSAYNAAAVALAGGREDYANALLIMAHQRDPLAAAPVAALRDLKSPLPTTRQELLGPFAIASGTAAWWFCLGGLLLGTGLFLRPPRRGAWIAAGLLVISIDLPSAIARTLPGASYQVITTPVTLVDAAGWPIRDLPSGTLTERVHTGNEALPQQAQFTNDAPGSAQASLMYETPSMRAITAYVTTPDSSDGEIGQTSTRASKHSGLISNSAWHLPTELHPQR